MEKFSKNLPSSDAKFSIQLKRCKNQFSLRWKKSSSSTRLYGGSLGIRDESALLSALEAPRWAYQYGQSDWLELAAIYFYHLMMNHGFTDGNKRVGTVAAILFLDIHGYWLDMPDGELEQLALQVAAGELEREEIAPRLRPYVTTTGES